MAGHSKWKQIKRQKGVTDQRRGALFTKLAREITIATKQGLPDPEANFRLRLAVQKAREANMPSDNIQRAITRASESGEGADLQEVVYEGYGPGGVAIMVEALTDNRNRTVSEVRAAFTRGGGSMGEAGSVGWQFDSRGLITVEAKGVSGDEVAERAIEAGADDFSLDGDEIEIYTAPTELEAVRRALLDGGLEIASAELSLVPKTPMMLEAGDAETVLRLLDRLEDLDDVQRVYSNAEFPEDVVAAMSA